MDFKKRMILPIFLSFYHYLYFLKHFMLNLFKKQAYIYFFVNYILTEQFIKRIVNIKNYVIESNHAKTIYEYQRISDITWPIDLIGFIFVWKSLYYDYKKSQFPAKFTKVKPLTLLSAKLLKITLAFALLKLLSVTVSVRFLILGAFNILLRAR